MYKDLKEKFAFTLAEVLITLGIIGIVSAMTIPTLINNYQKKVTVTRLQQTYSMLNQALNCLIKHFLYFVPMNILFSCTPCAP